jgi:hypothetical protein
MLAAISDIGAPVASHNLSVSAVTESVTLMRLLLVFEEFIDHSEPITLNHQWGFAARPEEHVREPVSSFLSGRELALQPVVDSALLLDRRLRARRPPASAARASGPRPATPSLPTERPFQPANPARDRLIAS